MMCLPHISVPLLPDFSFMSCATLSLDLESSIVAR
jgi:hypothetical protein